MSAFLAPGLHRIAPTRYHEDPCERPSLSSTLARAILDHSPLHAWTASKRLNPNWQPTDSKVFDIGRAAHRAVLGAGDDFAVIPDEILATNGAASTKEAKAFVADCRERGVTPIKADEAEELYVMADICRARLREMGIEIDPERSELAALAEIDGVAVRALIDNAPSSGPLIDFKTARDASPDACIRAVTGYGYDVQIAHYLECWEAAAGERRTMLLVFQEKTPPYELSVVELLAQPDHEADWMDDAHHKCAEARRIWGECLSTGRWPGYPARVALVGAPTWHRQRWADRVVLAAPPSAAIIARTTQWQAPTGDAA